MSGNQSQQTAAFAKTGFAFVGAGVGAGAASLALITIAQGQLSDLHLHPDVKIALVVLTGLLGAIVAAVQSALKRRSEEVERSQALAVALVGGPTQAVSECDPLDLGLQPGAQARAPYLRRPQDDRLEEVMHEHWLACVVGPPASGKTRAAFVALQHERAAAKLVCPVDAKGLATVLAGCEHLLRALADHEDDARTRKIKHPLARFLATRWAAVRRLVGPVRADSSSANVPSPLRAQHGSHRRHDTRNPNRGTGRNDASGDRGFAEPHASPVR